MSESLSEQFGLRYGVPTYPDVQIYRNTDPSTSREAAAVVAPAEKTLQSEIRRVLERWGPMTAERIADAVISRNRTRWKDSTIVTACNPNRSGLVEYDRVVNARGRTVIRWRLP